VSESKKKKSEETKAALKADLPLAQLILDCSKDKYRLVNAALRWAHEVKQREEKGTTQEIIDKALKEILAGQADLEMIEKLPPIPKSERPAPEPPKPLIIEKTEGEEKETKSKNGSDE
jgi:DNA-directed RNA polymerase subunit K/omega